MCCQIDTSYISRALYTLIECVMFQKRQMLSSNDKDIIYPDDHIHQFSGLFYSLNSTNVTVRSV
jgi:hypothetical protein